MSAGEQARAAELRAAFKAGAVESTLRGWSLVGPNEFHTRVDCEAARRYPDPAELRVVHDVNWPRAKWRYLPCDHGGGSLQYAIPAGEWASIDDDGTPRWEHTAARIALWSDLIAYPFIRDGEKRATA